MLFRLPVLCLVSLDAIVTRDLKDFRNSPQTVFSPSEFLIYLNTSQAE